MNVSKNLIGPPFFTSHLLNSLVIEKILDTTLTKENQRYYKVKWVKVTWEAEDDLAYVSNIVDQFWAQYTRECLLEPESGEGTTENSCQFSSTLSKDVYSFVTVPPNDIVASRSSNKITEPSTSDSLFLHGSSTDMLSMPTHPDLLSSPQASPADDSHVEVSTPGMLPPVINTNLFSDSCNDYSYTLNTDNDEFSDNALTPPKLTDTEITVVTQSVTEAKECTQPTISDVPAEGNIIIDEETTFNVTYKCFYCEATYKNKEKFLSHEKSHSNRKCTICGKQFQRISHLKTHMNIHNNCRPFPCDQCSKSFRDKSSLSKHKLVHTNSRQHKCNLCEMSFNRAQHLTRHLECHQKVKHFQCSQCGKKFNQKSAWKIHLNLHTGLKPYKCSICQEAFSDGSTLRRHTFIHNKPFKCDICNKSFSRDSTLRNHVSKAHCRE